MAKRKTHEEFVRDLNKVHGEGEYIPLEKYKGVNTRILVKHNKCGYEWSTTPSNLLQRHGCPKCAGNTKKTTEEFKKEIYEFYGDEYEILGKYINADSKIKVRHNSNNCNYHEYEVRASSLLKHGCPVCFGQEAKLGINTIWDTDRWMVDLGVSEEDAKRYSHSSRKKIVVRCPDCGREKKIAIGIIYNSKSIFCSCGDGKSYPEKFIINILEQLNIKYKKEYSPSWINNKRYDFYIKDNSCIIETHGRQHYERYTFNYGRGRTLEGEQLNDRYKKEIALKNGIKHYIELDCRNSNMEHIKNNMLNSELMKLFNLSTIDWNKAAEFANKNIVKEVCNYWNNKREWETTKDLKNEFKIHRTTIIDYLKKGTKMGWCNYDPKEERRKTFKINGNIGNKKIEIFKNNKSLGIFKSGAELSRQSEKLFGVKLWQSSISTACRIKQKQYKGFTFKYVK